MNNEKELEIDLVRCFRTIVRKWWFIAALAIVFAIFGTAVTLEKGDDLYSATSSVYGMSQESYVETQAGVKAMNVYMNIATSMKVCERAALMLGKSEITGQEVMEATTVSTGAAKMSNGLMADSAIMNITCNYKDPVVTMEMAQAVSEAFVIEMQNILGTDAVKVLDKPYSYVQSFNATRNQWKIRFLAFVTGALIAIVIIVIGEIFGSKACSFRECTMREELPIIGVIPRFKD